MTERVSVFITDNKELAQRAFEYITERDTMLEVVMTRRRDAQEEIEYVITMEKNEVEDMLGDAIFEVLALQDRIERLEEHCHNLVTQLEEDAKQ